MFHRIRPSTILSTGLLALAAGACGDSVGDSGAPVQLSLQTEFPASYTRGVFDLAVDRVRVRLIRPPAEAVVDTLIVFPPDVAEFSIRVKVPLIARREVLNASVQLSAGTRVLFSGTRELEVSDVPGVAPTIPLQYVGPGTSMSSLRIEPRDSALRPGQEFQYRVVAFSGATQIEDFYVGWTTSDPDHVAVDATGHLVVPAENGSFYLRVVSPTGIKDSTRVWISPPATNMIYVDGDEQTGQVATQLPKPLVVQVLTAGGDGVPGVPVRLTTVSAGIVRQQVSVSDAEGFARFTVVLGPLAGVQVFEATTAGLPTITFRATAKAGPPSRIRIVSGSDQQGVVGQILPNAFVARVTDASGNFIAGVPVAWDVVTGGGVLEQVDTQTNQNGVALGIYRLGTVVGPNAVRISVNNGNLSEDFEATGVPGPAATIDAVAGDGQTGAPGATLAPLSVLVTDEFGNVVPEVTVRWTIVSGGGTLSNETSTTDMNGRASIAYQLPLLPGVVHVRAQVGSVSTLFTVTAAEPPTASSMRSMQPDPRPARSGGFRRTD